MRVSAILSTCFIVAMFGKAFALEANTPQDPSSLPVALVPEPFYRFAPVLEGKKVTHAYVVKNTGTAPLLIQRVATTCGCTTADYSKAIAPGAEGSVTLQFNTSGYGGRSITKSATVFTNCLAARKIKLRMAGRVEVFAHIVPKKVRFSGAPGEPMRAVVTVVPSEKYPFRIVGEPLGNETHFRCHLEKQGDKYVLTLENVKETEGRYSGRIILKTDCPEKPEIKIPVYGRIKKGSSQDNK